MTNKEYWGENLQIVTEGKYANIYYRNDTVMILLANLIGDNIFELVEEWLSKDYNKTVYYIYKEN